MTEEKRVLTPEEVDFRFKNEILFLADMIKYNLFLLNKSIVFSALVSKEQGLSIDEATELTNKIVLGFSVEGIKKD